MHNAHNNTNTRNTPLDYVIAFAVAAVIGALCAFQGGAHIW